MIIMSSSARRCGEGLGRGPEVCVSLAGERHSEGECAWGWRVKDESWVGRASRDRVLGGTELE